MKLLSVKPQIFKFANFDEFSKEFNLGQDDLVFTHEFIYNPFMKQLNLKCDFMFQEKYGNGEPSSTMIDNVIKDMKNKTYKRVIAVGGGSVIDIAKLMALKKSENALALFEKRVPLIKERQLIIVPTTCGTGSEVTNISIAEIKEKHTKMGLSAEELYADYAVLIPELVKSLPYKFFVFSSIDALIHAFESFVSPKSNCYTEQFSISAIDMILKGYRRIIEKGEDFRFEIIEDFLIASNYAGIAFGNAGVGAVHALSYPLSGNYHVAHGEANYQFFTEVFKTYKDLKPVGKIQQLEEIVTKILLLSPNSNIYEALEQMLNKLLSKNKLRQYGMKSEEIELFTDSVIETQQRLLVNNYAPFSRTDILKVYKNLF